MRSNGRFRRVKPLSRRRRALVQGMAEAWATFAERSHLEAEPLPPSTSSGIGEEMSRDGEGDEDGGEGVSMETVSKE